MDPECIVCLSQVNRLIRCEGLPITKALTKHFWFKADDLQHKFLCDLCWTKIDEFSIFYEEVVQIHERNTQLLRSGGTSVNLETIVELEKTIKAESKLSYNFTDQIDCASEVVIKNDHLEETNEDSIINEQNYDDGYEQMEDTSSVLFKELENSESQEPTPLKAESLGLANITDKSSTPLIERIDEQIREYCKIVCEDCEEYFESFIELKKHSRRIHNSKGFVRCCNRKFSKRLRLKEHILKHLNPKAFMCTVCNKSYANTQGLKLHMVSHDPPESRSFKCDKCPRAYVKRYQLNAHKILHVADEDKKCICRFCNKAYANSSLLKSHIRSKHELGEEFICDICAKGFKIKSVFEKHRLEHDNTKEAVKVQCSVCCTWLKNASSLRKHMQRHDDAGGSFYCDVCGKQAPNKLALRSHKNFVHLSEKNHKCTLCSKAFKRAFTLKEHMTTHTGEILYSCSVVNCAKTFNSSANMHAHRKKSHPVEWLENHKSKTIF